MTDLPTATPDAPRPARLALSVWLVVAVVCMNLLAIFVGARGLWSSHQHAVAQATLTLNNLGNVLERNLSSSVTVTDFALQGITDSLEEMLQRGPLQDAAVSRLLAGYDNRYTEVSGFRISREDGLLWWGKGVERSAGLTIGDREYFDRQRAAPGRYLTVSPPLLGKLSQQHSLMFARSFRYPDGRFAGVVVAPMPIESLNRVLADVFLGTQGIAAIRHEDYSLVTVYPPPTNPAVVTGTKKISDELRELLEKGLRRADYRTANAPDGVDRLYSYRFLQNAPLMVIAGLSPGHYLGNWYDEARNVAILLLAMLLLSVLGTRLLLRFWQQKHADLLALQQQDTQLREALQAVDQREQLLRSAIDAIGEAFVIYDQDDRLVACNAQYKAYYAHSAAMIEPGRSFEEIIRYGVERGQYQEAVGREEEWIAERLRSHRDANTEFVQKLGDGRWLSVRERRSAAGHLVGFRVDITSFVQAKEAAEMASRALAESEGKFRQMFVDAPDAYLILGAESGTFLACNHAAERMLRTTQAGIVGKSPLELSPPRQADGRESGEAARDKIAKALSSGYQRFEWQHRRADGSDFWAEVAISPSVYGGENVLFAVWRDISDRKQTEHELNDYRNRLERMVEERTADLVIAKDAAEAASRAKTAFLSMASHELRTPMNGVIGTIALARRQAHEPGLLDYLNKADRASRQLLAIINDVLDISRIESAKFMLTEAPFSLDEIRLHVLDAVEAISEAKGLSLSYPADGTPVGQSYRGDALRLTQVLINLVGNALKFTQTGGVSVSVGCLPAIMPGHACLRFAVQDTGIGIPAEDLQRIFEPFEQSAHGGTRPAGGTGLGLALSKRLVEAMQGRMGVSSTPGAGSCFWFELELPVLAAGPEAQHAGEAHPEQALRARHGGRRILLVDDEPLNLEIAQAMLEEAGLAVDTACDGQEAVARAEGAPYALILMDMNMPRLNGIEATRRIRALPAHGRTPIIAMTANAFVEDRDACLQAGMNDHIGKPVMPDLLFATLLRWLEGGSPASARPAELSDTAAH